MVSRGDAGSDHPWRSGDNATQERQK